MLVHWSWGGAVGPQYLWLFAHLWRKGKDGPLWKNTQVYEIASSLATQKQRTRATNQEGARPGQFYMRWKRKASTRSGCFPTGGHTLGCTCRQIQTKTGWTGEWQSVSVRTSSVIRRATTAVISAPKRANQHPPKVVREVWRVWSGPSLYQTFWQSLKN